VVVEIDAITTVDGQFRKTVISIWAVLSSPPWELREGSQKGPSHALEKIVSNVLIYSF